MLESSLSEAAKERLKNRDLGKPASSNAWKDIVLGIRCYKSWLALSRHEIRRRYRRSVIGPFWLTISFAILIFGLGLLYSQLFKMDIKEFLPFLALGYIIWGHIASCFNEGTSVFISNGNVIKQSTVPLTLYIFQNIAINTIVFFHTIVIFFICAIVFKVPVQWTWLIGLFGFVVINVTLFGAMLFLASVSARYRDVPVVVMNIMMLGMFMTPIFWMPSMLPERALFLTINPFYYLVELFRAPLLGTIPPANIWIGALSIMMASLFVGIITFIYSRKYIAYWV